MCVDGVEVSSIHQDTDEDLIGDLNEDVGKKKGRPTIGFRRSFTHFVEVSLEHEAGHDLLKHGIDHRGDHKDGENDILRSLERGISVEECEADE